MMITTIRSSIRVKPLAARRKEVFIIIFRKLEGKFADVQMLSYEQRRLT
jgi:hypothetical protein